MCVVRAAVTRNAPCFGVQIIQMMDSWGLGNMIERAAKKSDHRTNTRLGWPQQLWMQCQCFSAPARPSSGTNLAKRLC